MDFKDKSDRIMMVKARDWNEKSDPLFLAHFLAFSFVPKKLFVGVPLFYHSFWKQYSCSVNNYSIFRVFFPDYLIL